MIERRYRQAKELVERLKMEACEDLDGEVRESAIEVMMEAAAFISVFMLDRERAANAPHT